MDWNILQRMAAIGLIVGAVTACSGSIVQRLAPGLVSDEQINLEAGRAYDEVIKTGPLSANRALTERVREISLRVARASGEPYEWEVNLIDADQLNAWCMPGGKMAVYSGILPVLETEAALAAVMGHEVAHATLKHGQKGYAQAIESQFAVLIIGAAAVIAGETLCETESCRRLTMIGGAAGALGVTFFQRKFSRDDETEADKIGQIYMATAGYDPAEAIRVWDRMGAASGGGGTPEFLSTHPSHERRKGNLQAWLPEARRVYQQAKVKYGVGQRLVAAR